jgi:hypothetical protein
MKPILSVRKLSTGYGKKQVLFIELPDATAQQAREAGLLALQTLERLLTEALRRRQAAERLLAIANQTSAAGIEPMRSRRRGRNGGNVRLAVDTL